MVQLLLFQKYSKDVFIKILFNKIKVIGPLGIIEKKLNIGEKKYYFILLLNPKLNNNNIFFSKKNISLFFQYIYKLVVGVQFGWYFGFNITGRGFSYKLKKKNDSFFLKLKIGFSHFVYFKLAKCLLLKISKKKNKLIIFGLDFWNLSNFANQLRRTRSKHIYKIQGIQFFNEKIVIKPGKKKQV